MTTPIKQETPKLTTRSGEPDACKGDHPGCVAYLSVSRENADKEAIFSVEEYKIEAPNLSGVFDKLRSEYGRCTGRVYIDHKDGATWAVGWVFTKRAQYDGNCYGKPETYLEKTWVSVMWIPADDPGLRKVYTFC